MKRWWVPALVAVAVLVVVGVGVGVLGAPGSDRPDSGGGFADGGSGAGQGAPPYSGTEPGDPGSAPGGTPPGGAPGDGGSEVPPGDGGSDGRPADPALIALDSFYRYDARHLALNFYNGVPECYGEAGTPRVEEREDRVVVAVPRTPPTAPKNTACIEIALAGSVRVTLTAPLGGRTVVDAATGRRLGEAASPLDESQAY
ncbi:MAG TPA: hypothetical protein VFV42_03705 [Acidimicrobiales bacterium]|nr:hypothetical protein [Acidimicrobiales bacterium]